MPFRAAHVIGYTRTQNGPDGCATVVHDEMTVDIEHGALSFVNDGTACVDVLGTPSHVSIEGEGTTSIAGGTGIYADVQGEGTWSVMAEVTGAGPGYLEGTFDELRFVGRLA